MTAQTPATAISTWTIDPAHTLVEFAVKHLMIATVKGRFGQLSGTIQIDEAEPTRSTVEVTIDAASIDTRDGQRDAHLRSADFLDVENFPAITFRSQAVEPVAENRHRIVGDFTIHGVTRPVTLDASFEGRGKDPWGNERVAFSATTRVQRSEFGLNWNAALEAGGFLVGNELKIGLEVEAIRQQ